MFYIPILVAIFGTAYFVFATDEDWKWKVLAIGILLLAFTLQFVPGLHTHTIVPFLIQSAEAIVMAIYWQVNWQVNR